MRTSLRASSPIWSSEASLARTRERAAKPRALRSRVLERLASLDQIGELARRLDENKMHRLSEEFCVTKFINIQTVRSATKLFGKQK